MWLWLSIKLNWAVPCAVSQTFSIFFPWNANKYPMHEPRLSNFLWANWAHFSFMSTFRVTWMLLKLLMRRKYSVTAEALALSTLYVLHLHSCTSGRRGVQLCLLHRLPPSLSCPSTGPSAGLWGALHLHAGDVPCEAPLEQDVRVGRLVITVQLPAHEVFSESLRASGGGLPGVAGSFAGFSAWQWKCSSRFYNQKSM